jgi:VWFA-related protein
MARSLILVPFVAFLGASAPVQQTRDGGDFSISVNVHLAVFNVSVTDSNGRHVTGLKATDFKVSEEGESKEIKLFNAEDAPATVGLIIDNSGSMRAKRTDVQRAALAFIMACNPADELFVVHFNEKLIVGLPPETPFTSDFEKIRAALVQTSPDGRTALYDAVATGLDHLKSGTHDRKALVVLSDGGDNASRTKLDDVLGKASRSFATIYTIGIYDESDPDKNPGVLRRIAHAGGGRAYFPESLGNLDKVWRDIAGEIRGQYTIGYVPTANDNRRFRNVKIVASRAGRTLRVATREGYVIPDEPATVR